MKDTTLNKALVHIRPILHKTLKELWNSNQFLPTPAPEPFPFVALLVDTTTIETYRPTAPFHEAKKYWDQKNRIYGIKKEVAVCVSPHYCLFTQKGLKSKQERKRLI